MPHLTVEYSTNLERRVDMAAVVRAVHEAALGTGVFPEGGIRTRAARRDLFLVADGNDENAFVHVSARIGAGRSDEIRRKAGERIFESLSAVLEDAYASGPLAISLEISEIDPVASFKRNNLHARLQKRESA